MSGTVTVRRGEVGRRSGRGNIAHELVGEPVCRRGHWGLGFLRGGLQQLYDAFGEPNLRALAAAFLKGAAGHRIRNRATAGWAWRFKKPDAGDVHNFDSADARCQRACSQRLGRRLLCHKALGALPRARKH